MSTKGVTAIAERILVILINLSWQLALVFILAWLLAVTFRMRSASARQIIWLVVVLCPVLLVPMNIVSSDIVLIRAGSSEAGATIGRRFGLDGLSFDPGEGSFSTIAPAEDSSGSIAPIERSVEGEQLEKPMAFDPTTEMSSHQRVSQGNMAKSLSGKSGFDTDFDTALPTQSKSPTQPAIPGIGTKPKALLVYVWIFGVGVSMALILAGYLRLRKLISQAHEIRDQAVLRIFHQVKEDIGVSRSVRLLASGKARTPFSIGFIHPCVILPARMLSSDEKLRMVLIHEIVHLKRFDDLINLICRVIGAFMFFHPLFHLAARELRTSSEQVCDGWAIKLTGMREDYANCLMELSRSCVGRLPIGFGKSGGSMARRVKSILKDKEVFTMMGRKSITLLSVSALLLILAVSTVRLVDPASAGQSAHISRIDRFQQCENNAGAGFFWVDTTNGKTWWAAPGRGEWLYAGQPEGKKGKIGTYMPCPSKCGGGLFILNTTTGEAWWTQGYKQEWVALELGKPETSETGDVGAYMPCEKEVSDLPRDFGGLYVLNTASGSGWWTPPSNKQGRYPTIVWSNPDAKAGEIGTYMPYRNSRGIGLFVINTATGEAWWTDGEVWSKLDGGKPEEEKIGTFMPQDNKDGAGIFILSTETGEGWWTGAPEASAYVEEASKRQQGEVTDAKSLLRKELDQAKQRLFEAEEALVSAQEKGVLDSLTGENNILISGLAKLKADLVEIELQFQEAVSELQNVMRHAPTPGSPEITKLQDKLADLKIQYKERAAEYSDQHPEVKALQKKITEMEQELEQAESTTRQREFATRREEWEHKIKMLDAKKMWLREKIDEYEHKLKGLPRRQMELARLQRDKAIAENTYSMLLQKLNEVQLLGRASETPPWTLIDRPHQLTLRISDPEPGMTYGTVVLNDRVVSMETLFDNFQRTDRKDRKMLVIQAGRDVPHDQIVEIMDLAKRAGIEKIGFAVIPRR